MHQNSTGVKPAPYGTTQPPEPTVVSNDQVLTAAVARVRQLIANGRHKTAVEQAKEVHKTYRCAASEGLLIDAYVERIQDLVRQNLTVEANSLLGLVRERYPSAAERLARLAVASAARAGKLDELLKPLNNPSLPPEHLQAIESAIQEQVADLAALAACPALTAEHPLRQAAASLHRAFEAITSGPVAEEALALPEVSRRSPLAPWKMLIRAIAAFYRHEDETCRRYLDAIKPDSGPVRLIPAIQCMLDNTSDGSLEGAGAELVSQVTGNVLELRHALEKLDRAFASEDDENRVLDAIRAAIQVCRRHAPGQLERLKQHISARAAVEYFDVGKTRDALGGPARHDAYFHRLLARGLEQQSDDPSALLSACVTWNEFRLAAVQEGWFAPNGVAAAALYLQMAKLLDGIPEGTIRSFEQIARKNAQAPEDFFYLHPEKLYERACALDPHSEAFSQWIDWAKQKPGADIRPIAEAWHKICPQDIEPVLSLMRASEEQRSFPKALQYLVEAERIDGLNPEVRRARLRLLAGNAIYCLQKKKPDLAVKSLEEMSALPQAQQGDRPAYVSALRYLAALVRRDLATAQVLRGDIERLLGSRPAAELLVSTLAFACKRSDLQGLGPAQKLDKSERAALPAVLARLAALAGEAQLALRIPPDWMRAAAAQFRRSHSTLDESQLQALGEMALEFNDPKFAYAVSAAGLQRGDPAAAQFLLLRARCLPQANFERRMVCAAAAAKLAREYGQQDLAAKALEFLRGPFKDGSIELSPGLVVEVLQKERKESAYPKRPRQGPNYRSIVGSLCPCPDCRRERGEMVDEFEDLDEDIDLDEVDEQDPFGGLELPKDMPPEIAEVLMEEIMQAINRGETLDQFLARLGGEGLPRDSRGGKGRRRGRR